MDRRKAVELIQRVAIPSNTVAICADRDPAEVSNYRKGIRVSSAAELAIGRAVSEIVSVVEKSAPIRPDLSNGEYIRNLIRSWREDAVFCVMVQAQPTAYFLNRKDGRVYSTNFLMQSAALTKGVAEVIAVDLRAAGYEMACAIQNPYGSIDQRYPIEDGDPRQTEEYRLLMGTTASAEQAAQ